MSSALVGRQENSVRSPRYNCPACGGGVLRWRLCPPGHQHPPPRSKVAPAPHLSLQQPGLLRHILRKPRAALSTARQILVLTRTSDI